MNDSQFSKAINCLLMPVVAAVLLACGSSSGPIVKHGGHTSGSAAVWQEPLIEECMNVSMAKRIRAYESRFHHSTEKSLVPEIIQVASKSEFDHEGETDSTARLRKEFSNALVLQTFGLDGSDDPFEPFCMSYDAPAEVVTMIVKKTLPVLGNKILADREQFGKLYTEILERENINTKWRDAYFIDIEAIDSKTSAVRIYRHLEILRASDKWVYAQSDGHNEAWLLQWIKTSLST